MSGHTEGPWHVGGRDKCTVYDKFHQRLANSFEGVMTTQKSDSECQANARLIAAAPDYYEATAEIFQAVENNDAPVDPFAALEELALYDKHITLDAGLVLNLLKAHARAQGIQS